MNQPRSVSALLALGSSLLSVSALAAVDMDAVLEAEYAGIEAAMCPQPAADAAGGGAPMDDYAAHAVEPFQVFDNLYFIGMDNISAWALTTSEGIILFEAMMVANWEQTVVDGLETLGLDPNDIEYVVIGHAHNDHWGGAAFLQQRYGAEVLMGEPDWDHILTWPQIGRRAPIPDKGRGIRDGDTLTLGDTTVRFVATPGHTPGTVSSLIPVRDGDDWHLAAYWGGPSMSFLPPEGLEQYIGSTFRLQNADPGIDVELTNHPWGDGTFAKRDALAEREPGDPHPFVTGNDGVKRWLEQLRHCTRAVLSEKRAAAAAQSGTASAGDDSGLAPISVSGSYWIELSPVVVAAESFYPEPLSVGEGGITRITSGEVDLATNAETQLLRESVVNPDLRIIMTVTESFYRLVARRSAGIETLADLRGKRVMVPRRTSANYYLVAMLKTVGLTEDDVELVRLPRADDVKTSLDLMSEALLSGEADVISIWEPEPEDAIRRLGDDAVVFQDRSVYREVFNLHATATALADPDKRRSIVAFVRAVADATEALQEDPEAHWPHVSSVIDYTEEQIAAGWPEMEFPVRIVPDMLDVLETEEAWVAEELDREPRSRQELAGFIDTSVLEEALAGR